MDLKRDLDNNTIILGDFNTPLSGNNRQPDRKSTINVGVNQARILEWVATAFSRGSSQPKDQTQVFLIAGRLFTS